MRLVLDKLKIDLQEAFEKTDIIVDDITFEEKRKVSFLNGYFR